MILFVASSKDPAGTNISKQVLERYSFSRTNDAFEENPAYIAEVNGKWITHITLKEEAFNAQHLENSFTNLELVVFLSRHSSQSGKPTLSVHTPGNIAAADLGGLPQTLSVSPANAMRDALKALSRLNQEKQLGYEVSYECTHHGPSLTVPAMFVELGSSPKQWSDETAACIVAQAAVEAASNFGSSPQTAVIGIGGTHYNQKFTKMALLGEASFGHMIPKYAISVLSPGVLIQCMEKTVERVESAILDWKGIKSEDKLFLLATLQQVDLPFQKV